jgi:hypothetical protein
MVGAGPAIQRRSVIPALETAPSTPPFDAPKAALRVLRNFKMGALCPAEMWAQLADVLSRGDVRQILDTLPPELQTELRDSYRERPLSFWVLRGSPLRRQIKRWCRGSPVRRQG